MAIPISNGVVNPRPEDVPWLGETRLPKPFDDALFRTGKNFVSFQPVQFGGDHVVSAKPMAISQFVADGIVNGHEIGQSYEWPDDINMGEKLLYTNLHMATALIEKPGEDEVDSIRAALERCFESLRPFEIAYSVTSGDIAYPLTTSISSVSACWFAIFDADQNAWGEPEIISINLTDGIRQFPPEYLTDEQVRAVQERTQLALVGFPLSSSEYWFRQAERSLYLFGTTDIAAIQAFTAGEVFLDSVLMMLAWEQISYGGDSIELTVKDVAAWYTLQNSHRWRLKNQFHIRLKTWNSGTPPIPPDNWLDIAAKTRSMIVHAGYTPSFGESEQVLSCYSDVVEFVKRRLAYSGNRNRYPRTVSMVLSEHGMRRLDVYVGKVKAMYEETGNRVWMEEFMEFRSEVVSIAFPSQ